MLNRIWGPNYVVCYAVRLLPLSPSHSQPDDFRIAIGSRPPGGGNITRRIRRRLSERELLLQDNGHCLSSLLMDMNVPVEAQDEILIEISEVARSAGTSTISIGVLIEQSTFDESRGYAVVFDTITRASEAKLTPATKSSIEALEKVTLHQQELDSVGGACVICTQEFEAGSEVTRMPCSHVYHEECIVKWLKKSNVCPLCRYSMPHRL